MEKHTVKLTSDCTCTNEDNTPSTDCFDCWDDSVWLFKDLMNTWRKTVGVNVTQIGFDEGATQFLQQLDDHPMSLPPCHSPQK
jgi:hypothetical protein